MSVIKKIELFVMLGQESLNTKVFYVDVEWDRVKLLISPVEKAYTVPLAVMLRHALLSTHVRKVIYSASICGVRHEYDMLPGTNISVIDFVSHLSKVMFYSDKTSGILTLNVSGPNIVCAANLSAADDASFFILNSDQFLCELGSLGLVKAAFRYDTVSSLLPERVNKHTLLANEIPINYGLLNSMHVSYNVISYNHYDELLFTIQMKGAYSCRSQLCSALSSVKYKLDNIISSL